MDTEIKPCPFCGKDEADTHRFMLEDGSAKRPIYAVCCDWCGCDGPSSPSEERAVFNWNNRVP